MKFISSIFLMSISALLHPVYGANCENKIESPISTIDKNVSEISATLETQKGSFEEEMPISCSSINLREAEINVKCITSKGAIYQRVSKDKFGEAWKGEDGIIWSDIVGTSSFYNANNVCTKIGGRLPSREDFEKGESKGFREVLPNIVKIPFETPKPFIFWTSTKSEELQNGLKYPLVFNGTNKDVYFAGYYDASVEMVRCVSR